MIFQPLLAWQKKGRKRSRIADNVIDSKISIYPIKPMIFHICNDVVTKYPGHLL